MSIHGLVDWRGNEIEVGDTIVYATSASSVVTMHEAVVDEIFEGDRGYGRKGVNIKATPVRTSRPWRNRQGEYKQVTLKAVERVMLLEKAE